MKVSKSDSFLTFFYSQGKLMQLELSREGELKVTEETAKSFIQILFILEMFVCFTQNLHQVNYGQKLVGLLREARQLSDMVILC